MLCVLDVPETSVFKRDLFDDQAAGREIVFLKNSSVKGFPASMNLAAGMHRERDFVLMDCETVVSRNWLERLMMAAKRSPAAGIVTPFSTGGEICHYPHSAEHAMSPADVDCLCLVANAGRVIDVPAVYGVCTLIRRSCLDEVGGFDEGLLQSRNSSMVDFCLHAGAKGWRTILAADVLVDSPIAQENDDAVSEALDQCHPYCGDLLVNFRVDDPALPLRRAIDLEILRSVKRPI